MLLTFVLSSAILTEGLPTVVNIDDVPVNRSVNKTELLSIGISCGLANFCLGEPCLLIWKTGVKNRQIMTL